MNLYISLRSLSPFDTLFRRPQNQTHQLLPLAVLPLWWRSLLLLAASLEPMATPQFVPSHRCHRFAIICDQQRIVLVAAALVGTLLFAASGGGSCRMLHHTAARTNDHRCPQRGLLRSTPTQVNATTRTAAIFVIEIRNVRFVCRETTTSTTASANAASAVGTHQTATATAFPARHVQHCAACGALRGRRRCGRIAGMVSELYHLRTEPRDADAQQMEEAHHTPHGEHLFCVQRGLWGGGRYSLYWEFRLKCNI